MTEVRRPKLWEITLFVAALAVLLLAVAVLLNIERVHVLAEKYVPSKLALVLILVLLLAIFLLQCWRALVLPSARRFILIVYFAVFTVFGAPSLAIPVWSLSLKLGGSWPKAKGADPERPEDATESHGDKPAENPDASFFAKLEGGSSDGWLLLAAATVQVFFALMVMWMYCKQGEAGSPKT